jgi:flagellar biosynthesis/type III secretory pathway protein FliH
MSEQKLNVAEIDEWIEDEVMTTRDVPDVEAGASDEELDRAWDRGNERIRYKVRQKIQEAYNDGFKAGAQHVREETREAAAEIFRLMTRIFR